MKNRELIKSPGSFVNPAIQQIMKKLPGSLLYVSSIILLLVVGILYAVGVVVKTPVIISVMPFQRTDSTLNVALSEPQQIMFETGQKATIHIYSKIDKTFSLLYGFISEKTTPDSSGNSRVTVEIYAAGTKNNVSLQKEDEIVAVDITVEELALAEKIFH